MENKRKKRNKLSKIIGYELICLAVVTVIVFGAVRWSEKFRASRPSGAVKAGQESGENLAASGSLKGKNVSGDVTPGGQDAPGDVTSAGEDVLGNATSGKGDVPGDVMPDGQDVPGDVTSGKEDAPGDATSGKGDIPGDVTPGGQDAPGDATSGKEDVPGDVTPGGQDAPGDATSGKGDVPGDVTSVPAVKSEIDAAFIETLSMPQSGEILEAKGAIRTVYYRQTDSRWGSLYYGGTDTLAKYACGPTSMAIVVSSLTDIGIDPVQMSKWAYDRGYWVAKSGSAHTIVNGTAKAFGLKSEGVGNDADTAKKVIDNLKNGGMTVALMGKGHFTKGGHFIVLRGITEDGKILVADCNSRDNTLQEWDLETLLKEAKYAIDGGPFWNIKRSMEAE